MSKFISKIVVIILSLTLVNSTFAVLLENKDYVILEKPVSTSPSSSTQVEVIEFFSYGCPYCYTLEPQINAWLSQKPDNVNFTRVAIPRKGKWVEYARLFYALEMISHQEQERMTPLIYAAIHDQGLNFGNINEIFDWAESENVDRALLEKFYNSQDVTEKLSQAVTLAQAYNLQYVPSIYIDGKYQILINSANQYQDVKDKLNEFIEILGN
ncbi:thiol:disulfide interchange protein DsbA/DsbL [Orbus sturtevantii]|uniref:thiol:disulfide interchange protein DsbA/DsbL n=1 Tax=Orbus sturtevantii TaxID=3074109 RepID=UPI00370D734B